MKREEKTKDRRSRSRSSMGCLTCRRKRKKCDEKLYPTCLRCQEKHLVCEWPLKVQQIQQQLGQVRYIGNDDEDEAQATLHKAPHKTKPLHKKLVHKPKDPEEFDISQMVDLDYRSYELSQGVGQELGLGGQDLLPGARAELPDLALELTPDHLAPDTEKSKKQSFLERIALQQDCVDDL